MATEKPESRSQMTEARTVSGQRPTSYNQARSAKLVLVSVFWFLTSEQQGDLVYKGYG